MSKYSTPLQKKKIFWVPWTKYAKWYPEVYSGATGTDKVPLITKVRFQDGSWLLVKEQDAPSSTNSTIYNTYGLPMATRVRVRATPYQQRKYNIVNI